MTTIIIIIAVAALVGLGSKIFLKDSSRGGSMEGRTLWIWSQTLGKTGNLAGAVSRGQEAQKIYEKLKKSEASNIRPQIEKWSEN